MDTFQLKVFSTVAELKSFSKAAKQLHMSQPAISTQIKHMEDHFSVLLFERTSSGVKLTHSGEVLYSYAKEILRLEDEMNKGMASLVKVENAQINIGASTTLGNFALPCAIYMFKEEFPDIDIHLEIANTQEIVHKFTNNELDLAVIDTEIKSNLYRCIPLICDELVYIGPHYTPDVNGKLPLKDLLTRPLILREEGSGTRETFVNALKKINLTLSDLNIITEMSTFAAIKSSVEAGMGGSIVPRMTVRKEEYLKLIKVLPIEDLPMPINYYLIYNPKKATLPLKKLVHYLSDPEEHYLC